ncbi:hypothetical protein M514_18186 [Trichuris suis]|uniref:Uncharacterized protein n=1 Tax=Trichuris suis TaxID=68888 RepID=A0A085NJC4_9BILA|nr:hypothetical protein M514_18186 [Trichuris suis]
MDNDELPDAKMCVDEWTVGQVVDFLRLDRSDRKVRLTAVIMNNMPQKQGKDWSVDVSSSSCLQITKWPYEVIEVSVRPRRHLTKNNATSVNPDNGIETAPSSHILGAHSIWGLTGFPYFRFEENFVSYAQGDTSRNAVPLIIEMYIPLDFFDLYANDVTKSENDK